MSGVNKAIILGNVGNDPEVTQLENGTTIASLSVATSEQWKDKNTGEKQEKTEWHRITAFGRLAEIIADYIKKGSKIYIEGRIQTDKYEKEGVTHYSTKIIASQMQMLDSRDSNSQTGNTQQSAQSQHKQAQQSGGFDNFDDDLVPF